MKKNYMLLLMLSVICIFQKAQAQQIIDSGSGRAQNVFVELGGQGLLFTANYDTRFSNKRNGIGGRAGVGYLSIDGDNVTTIPVGLNYLLGKGKSFFEVGLGATVAAVGSRNDEGLFFEDGNANTVIGTMSFSYRLQPIDSGFSLRAGLTPIFNADGFIPYYAGFSLGYTFSGKHK